MRNINEILDANPYPGRGIVLGVSPDSRYGVIAYFIMGRSENSRNRVFVATEDGIRTEAHDRRSCLTRASSSTIPSACAATRPS